MTRRCVANIRTDRLADHGTCDTCSNRPYGIYAMHAMRPISITGSLTAPRERNERSIEWSRPYRRVTRWNLYWLTECPLAFVTVWCWWHVGPVVVGNVGDKSASSYRLHASETQQLSCVPMAVADATPTCMELLGGNRQPVTGRLATHPSNTPVMR